jgi:hypothetical protein
MIKSFEEEKNEFAVTTNKITNNFAGFITSGLGLDVSHRLPVGPCRLKPFFGTMSFF